jgi:hypothetical protein
LLVSTALHRLSRFPDQAPPLHPSTRLRGAAGLRNSARNLVVSVRGPKKSMRCDTQTPRSAGQLLKPGSTFAENVDKGRLRSRFQRIFWVRFVVVCNILADVDVVDAAAGVERRSATGATGCG